MKNLSGQAYAEELQFYIPEKDTIRIVWCPQIKCKGKKGFIPDKSSPSGIVECQTCYEALRYSRDYLYSLREGAET